MDAGITTLKQMIAANQASIPGNNDMDAVAAWVAWLQGKVAMLYSWPPTGRMSENYAQRDKAINFVPQSNVVGKVGYAVMPGGNPSRLRATSSRWRPIRATRRRPICSCSGRPAPRCRWRG